MFRVILPHLTAVSAQTASEKIYSSLNSHIAFKSLLGTRHRLRSQDSLKHKGPEKERQAGWRGQLGGKDAEAGSV